MLGSDSTIQPRRRTGDSIHSNNCDRSLQPLAGLVIIPLGLCEGGWGGGRKGRIDWAGFTGAVLVELAFYDC